MIILALVLLLSLLLNLYTGHNKEIEVPDLSGMGVEEARSTAKKHDIRIDITDSVFVSHLELGSVFSQNPEPGAKVKKGRRVLLTINATQPKTVPMPALVGLSLRGAKARIASSGLTVGRLKYVPDMATNNVLEQRVGGKRITAGRRVKVETPVDLTLGMNEEDSFTYVPYVIGFSLDMAREVLTDHSLNIGRVIFDSTVQSYSDSLQAVVYTQSPAFAGAEGNCILGTEVSLWLSLDPSKVSK